MIQTILMVGLWLVIGYLYAHMLYNSAEVREFVAKEYPDDPEYQIRAIFNLAIIITTVAWPIFMTASVAINFTNWINSWKGEVE